MNDDDTLFRAPNDATASVRWIESFDFIKNRVLLVSGDRLTQWLMAVSFFEAAEPFRKIASASNIYDLFKRDFTMFFFIATQSMESILLLSCPSENEHPSETL